MKDEFQTIKNGLKRLQSAKPRPDVFGAESHEFRLNPTLTEASVQEFERKRAIRLPEDYRQFLLEIGNGGAGPYYGVFKLGEMDANWEHELWQENGDFVGDLSEPFPHTGAWNDLSGQPDEDEFNDEDEYYQQLEAFEEKYFHPTLVNGAFPLCHQGCAYRNWLVVNGPERGHVWFDGRASDEGLAPVSLPGKERVTFYEWYRHWLDEAIALLDKA